MANIQRDLGYQPNPMMGLYPPLQCTTLRGVSFASNLGSGLVRTGYLTIVVGQFGCMNLEYTLG